MKTKQLLSFALAAILCCTMLGCAPSNQPQDNNQPTNAPQDDNGAFINLPGESAAIALRLSSNAPIVSSSFDSRYTVCNNGFATTMINTLSDDWSGVYSPLSLQLTLQMLANGGDEETMNAMLSAICQGLTRDDINASAARLISLFGQSKGVGMASALIASNLYQVNSEYASLVADYYRASVGALDFSDSGRALNEINGWVSEVTLGQINKLLDEINPQTAAILLNTLTLDLRWETPFNAFRELSDFYGTNGKQSIGMISANGKYDYGSFDCGQMAVIPYAGGEYCMALMLPSEGVSPQEAVNQLMGRWDECKSADCYISMPKVKLDSTLDIMTMLDSLGIKDAVNGNYSGILANSDSGSIGQIVQGATLSITESGTTAAAASAATVEKGDFFTPAYVMECNRPYAAVIYHAATGTVLFVTVVNNVG